MSAEMLHTPVQPTRAGSVASTARRSASPGLTICPTPGEAPPDSASARTQPDIAALYQQYRNNVHRFISRRVRDQNEAEDLTQETFLQAHRSAARFEGKSSVLTWLLGIARHICMRHLRHSSRWMIGADGVHYSVDPATDSRTDSRVDAIRKLERCGKVIQECRGESHQEIFRRRYGEQESIREIAAHVGKSKEAVKGSLCRSRKALQHRIHEL